MNITKIRYPNYILETHKMTIEYQKNENTVKLSTINQKSSKYKPINTECKPSTEFKNKK
jgi:hypothetical protein